MSSKFGNHCFTTRKSILWGKNHTFLVFSSPLRKLGAPRDGSHHGLISSGWPGCLVKHRAQCTHFLSSQDAPPALWSLRTFGKSWKAKRKGREGSPLPLVALAQTNSLPRASPVHFSTPVFACFLFQPLWMFASHSLPYKPENEGHLDSSVG